MMEVEQLWQEIDARARRLEPVPLPLEEAVGLVLAGEIRAAEDMPAFDRSAMDGYAVPAEDASREFRVVAEIRTGDAPRGIPGVGCAARVFTGGPVPPGACVVMQEDVVREGDRIRLLRPPGHDFVRKQGSDARRGDVLLAAGTRLGPGEIAVLAASGNARPLVCPRPKVAHAVTGDEIVGAGEIPAPGQVRDSNGPLISALLTQSGIRGNGPARWRDDPEGVSAGLSSAPFAGADLLLVSGGAGGGDHDHTRWALERAGFEVHCSRVNSRPGRPLLFASNGRRLAFGLPGNPLSHFVVFHLFVARALARLGGGTPRGFQRAFLAADSPGEGGKGATFRPCRVHLEDGTLRAVPIPWNNSGHVGALAGASGLLRAAPGMANLSRGENVDVIVAGELS